ncbi:MAG: carboxypeptidase regulatory-like domain-containing protein [bacterium]|nr:carboxypeptidase regulatory-like domain-containing protein [bacterium]
MKNLEHSAKIISIAALIVIFVMTFQPGLNAQSGVTMKLSGFVKNAYTNRPVHGAVITLYKIESGSRVKAISGKSDWQGYYKVRFLEGKTGGCKDDIRAKSMAYRNRVDSALEEKHAYHVSDGCKKNCKEDDDKREQK